MVVGIRPAMLPYTNAKQEALHVQLEAGVQTSQWEVFQQA